VLELSDLKIVKLFVDDGNTLNFYPNTLNRGRLIIEDKKRYDIKIVIRDFPGHKDSIQFKIIGKKDGITTEIPERIFYRENVPVLEKKLFYPNANNTLEVKTSEAILKIEIPKGVLYDTVLFRIDTWYNNKSGNTIWNVMSSSIPVNDSFLLAFKPLATLDNPNKYVIIRLTKDGKKRPEGGIWKDGYLTTKAKMLGQFYYTKDEIAPTILTVKLNGRQFTAKVKDELSGIKEITTTIDGEWILTDYEPKSDFISGKIPDVITTGKHELIITVGDTRGNYNSYKKTINL